MSIPSGTFLPLGATSHTSSTVSMMNTVQHPEKRSFRNLKLSVIVPRFYIYTVAKESEPYSFQAFKT